ncbi:hypothetical protein GH741_08760 [Aquibacillus halophilus]|uniref:Uncharacterized protein n=1 Tax=Aquibacillus halophilus TaxID=930132 RepID=A0A6A8DIL7_9BACI|nr:hypothetical protein [Aquibacillus halophilus]
MFIFEESPCIPSVGIVSLGKATAENPAGSGILPRKLKRCPRKATVRSANQLVATLRRNLHQL